MNAMDALAEESEEDDEHHHQNITDAVHGDTGTDGLEQPIYAHINENFTGLMGCP